MIEKVYYKKLLLNFADFLSGKPKHSVDAESSSHDDSENDTSLLAHPSNECNEILVDCRFDLIQKISCKNAYCNMNSS